MSLEEAAARRQDMRDRAAERRLNESLEETAARREAHRLRAMSCRAVAQHQSSCARHDVHDQCRLGRLAANRTKFRQSLLLGPLATCYSCSMYTYPSGGSYVDSDNAMLQPLHGCANSHILPEGEDSVWLCTRCRNSLKEKWPLLFSCQQHARGPSPP